MIMKKGFITLAAGDYYCKLAEHLYMSYKLFGNCDLPFFVITDHTGCERLNSTFDGVIVKDNLQKSTVDKLLAFTETPFQETIFIDADCSIVNDVNYIFERFEENGSDISGIGQRVELNKKEKGVQFGFKAKESFDIQYDFHSFNGGVYYYNKTELGRSCVHFIFNRLLPNYHEYELKDSEHIYDEPLVIVGMLKYGMKPLPLELDIMRLVHNANNVSWNMKKHECSFLWYEQDVHPTIIHWSVGRTETYVYEKYDAEVRGRYFHTNRIQINVDKAISWGKYSIYPNIIKAFPKFRSFLKGAFKE